MPELGDHVKQALESVGISEEKVTEWLGRPCGCDERREKLNSISRWAKQTARLSKDKAKGYLKRIIGA